MNARSSSLAALLLLAGLDAGCKKESASSALSSDAGDAGTSAIALGDAAPPEPARGMPITATEIAKVVNPSGLPAYDGPTGSLEGRITVVGDPAPPTNVTFTKCPRAEAEKVYAKAFREGEPLPGGARPLGDALVIVTGYSGFYIPERTEAKTITIDDCAFSVRTLDLTFGQRVEIANKTPGQLFAPALEKHPMAALMVAPFGADAVKIWPRAPGFDRMVDRLGHDYMTVDVYTLLQPLHAVSKLDGTYRIDGVPVGKLEVHARLRAINDDVSAPVEIRKNVVARVDLQMHYREGALDAGVMNTQPAVDAGPPRIK